MGMEILAATMGVWLLQRAVEKHDTDLVKAEERLMKRRDKLLTKKLKIDAAILQANEEYERSAKRLGKAKIETSEIIQELFPSNINVVESYDRE